jgi:hypothetical protein
MARASRAFQGATLTDAVLKGAVSGLKIPNELQRLARLFSNLQEMRHEADYDLTLQLKRQDVTAIVESVQDAMSEWRQIRNDPCARLFLLSLLYWERMSKAPR